jgi:hypothetical protein
MTYLMRLYTTYVDVMGILFVQCEVFRQLIYIFNNVVTVYCEGLFRSGEVPVLKFCGKAVCL